MRSLLRSSARPTLALATLLAMLAGGSPEASAQANLPYTDTPSFQSRIDPYGINYNASAMSYGLPGVGVSPWNPIVQAQLNLGMRTARYNMYNAWTASNYQAANLYNQQAVAQALQNQKMMATMAPRYDVRTQEPASTAATTDDNQGFKPLPKSQVFSPDGKVIWPSGAPATGELGKERDAAEAAILTVVKEFASTRRATIASVSEAKERLYAYGKPALRDLNRESRPDAVRLLRFMASLELLLDAMAGA
ncbi:hypothetical protein [Paludisphaera borealis]|uniref:Uncharacterized protein n=1 Tax=Paludisphaera borealis TaxID=1387353 RepID=A0A1U7CQX9_9BACT|nr:hypothetical protein [Paludisphaera borealis]APW61283.1 hypothetical protein BSF38_02795 [Paludisphaera borealis]